MCSVLVFVPDVRDRSQTKRTRLPQVKDRAPAGTLEIQPEMCCLCSRDT